MSKLKIINDPVWGFIHIPEGLVFDIINHRLFQRLRRILQMGLSFYVYPGAVHTRFNHSLGCLYLVKEAMDSLQEKGENITDKEREAVYAAVLLHDIGHAPLSHLLEYELIKDTSHEDISKIFMQRINEDLGGALDLAIEIFEDRYHKKYLHRLISGQLDVDRLDYLRRDSFYTGVIEGAVGTERILKMIQVVDGELAVEEKGIYSIEKFILSRRMMYWQVYLHKTSVCAEMMLLSVMKRARFLVQKGDLESGSPSLISLLKNFGKTTDLIDLYADVDDSDIWLSLKQWSKDEDKILSMLSSRVLDRELFRTSLRPMPVEEKEEVALREDVAKKLGGIIENEADLDYFYFSKILSPKTYNPEVEKIMVLRKNGTLEDITKVSELLDQHFVNKKDKKKLIAYY